MMSMKQRGSGGGGGGRRNISAAIVLSRQITIGGNGATACGGSSSSSFKGGGKRSSFGGSSSNNSTQIQVCVMARLPRKRSKGVDDSGIQNTLRCYMFLDDPTKFTNLDMLLTQFGPSNLGTFYVSCTESAEINEKQNADQIRKKTQLNKYLDRVCETIESRGNSSGVSNDDNDEDDDKNDNDDENPRMSSAAPTSVVVHKYTTLGNPLQREEDAIEFTDHVMMQLLSSSSTTSETNYDPHKDAAVVSYRGNRLLSETSQTKQTLGLLLRELGFTATTSIEDHHVGGEGPLYEFEMGRLTSHLQLDRVASEAINLFPTPRTAHNLNPTTPGGTTSGSMTHNVNTSSIYGILNQTRTKMGSRMLESWLRQPLVDAIDIGRRHDVVEFLVEHSVDLTSLRDGGLKAVMDLDMLSTKLGKYDSTSNGTNMSSSVALETLYKMYLFADQQLPLLILSLTDIDSSGTMVMEALDHEGSTTPSGSSNNNDPQQQHTILASQEEDEDGTGGHRTSSVASSNFRGRALKVLHGYRDELSKVEDSLQKARGLAETVLDMDRVPQDYLVKPNFDDELQSLRQELDDLELQLKQVHQTMDEEWANVSGHTGQVRLERTDSGKGNHVAAADKTEACAWQFRLPNTNDERILREQFADTVYVHRVLKNGVYFSTKELQTLASTKQDLLKDYQSRQSSIVSQAMKVASTFCPVLEQASSIIAELDVLCGFAYVAAYQGGSAGYCRPIMTDYHNNNISSKVENDDNGCNNGQDTVPRGGIVLRKARHPCVELRDVGGTDGGGSDFIPNDFDLTYNESSFQLITGPNMGGKSTYIRSLGAIVAMAQVGSFVPCESATINIVDCILARVGAGDAQQRGISTFMAEMLEASSIIQSATSRSLIIIDELGRGTSTADGYGIAWAISEYIIQRIGCFTVFATHFHELTALEEKFPNRVKNYHVTAEKSSTTQGLTFFYEVRPGPCLESFGIQVAEMAHVPSVVIENAKRKAKELERFSFGGSTTQPPSAGSMIVDDDDSETIQKMREQARAYLQMKDTDALFQELKAIPLATSNDEERLDAVSRILGISSV